jgi:hypothetical protein
VTTTCWLLHPPTNSQMDPLAASAFRRNLAMSLSSSSSSDSRSPPPATPGVCAPPPWRPWGTPWEALFRLCLLVRGEDGLHVAEDALLAATVALIVRLGRHWRRHREAREAEEKGGGVGSPGDRQPRCSAACSVSGQHTRINQMREPYKVIGLNYICKPIV